ncbi:MAG: ABC transporter permease [Christensenellaceae bacterium]|nr:ABC transporter permease [Christensenellaceae bacterium]
MKKTFDKLLRKNEFYIFLVIIVVGLAIQFRSGQFFASNNLVDIFSAMIVPHLFGLGLFMIIVTGGIDISFPAIASLSCYITTKVMIDTNFNGSILVPLIMAGAIGWILGMLNGFLVVKFNFPALIITLGTQSIFRGINQGVLGAVQLPILPETMAKFGLEPLFKVVNRTSGLTSVMPIAAIIWVLAIVFVFLVMRFTMFGRGIYATGGNEVSAERAGFNVKKIKFLIYSFNGLLASIGGFIYFCRMGQYEPTNLIGMEMTIIAGVILGGTALTGGKGSLFGVFIGTFLMVLVDNSLILLGVPSFWKTFATGLLILIGVGISALQVKRASNRYGKSS